MKLLLISYMVISLGYGSGIDLYNHGEEDTIVRLQFQRAGEIVETVDQAVPAKGNVALDPTQYVVGAFQVLITCSDEVYVSPFISTGEGGITYLPVIELEPTVQNLGLSTSSVAMKKWGDTDYWTITDKTCPYLRSDFYQVISAILFRVYVDYPDRIARRASILCASTRDSSNPDDHPEGSHSEGKAIDVCYFTLGETNHTQIPYGTERVTQIWTDGGELNDRLDVARTFDLLSSICRATGAEIRVHDKIKKKLEEYAGEILTWLHGDSVDLYSHGRHAHVAPQKVIWDAII